MSWERYVSAVDADADALIRAAIGESDRLLVISGMGFDPRGPIGIEKISQVVDGNALEVVTIDLGPGSSRPTTIALAQRNRTAVQAARAAHGFIWTELDLPSVTRTESKGLVLTRQLMQETKLAERPVVVVDISSLPTDLYFPIVRAMLEDKDFRGNLLLAVCENPEIDRAIEKEGAESATTVPGYRAGLFAETSGPSNVVWAPVLGSVDPEELQKIHTELVNRRANLVEICPVLPFPAKNPREADNIVLRLRRFLSDEARVDPQNYIYAAESNPFDLYRQIGALQGRYQRVLGPLGPTKIVPSSHSSKMLSVGVLLAAVSYDLPVMQVVRSGYWFTETLDVDAALEASELHLIWLAGDPYNDTEEAAC